MVDNPGAPSRNGKILRPATRRSDRGKEHEKPEVEKLSAFLIFISELQKELVGSHTKCVGNF
jgi:hypothetical protein